MLLAYGFALIWISFIAHLGLAKSLVINDILWWSGDCPFHTKERKETDA